MPQFALSLLGPPRVRRDGADVKLERSKGLALLAYLAVRGEALRRDELAALLWPEFDQVHARSSLRRVLWDLSAKLPGAWWVVERETIGLVVKPEFDLDIARFGTLLAMVKNHPHSSVPSCPDCRARLAEAVALYRGDFLAGFTLRGCVEFDAWQLSQTDRWRSTLGAALELLATACAAQGEFDTAITHALGWLALDPLHEPAHQQLMRLYAWSGQRSAALRQFDACVRLLEAELGVSPHENTRQLLHAIRDDQLARPDILGAQAAAASLTPVVVPNQVQIPSPTAASGAHHHLAALDRIARGQFIGRELEWAQVGAAWQRAMTGVGQVLLISGEPGIGKSRLVRELVQAARGTAARVLIGECAVRGERPYAPFTQIVQEILDRPGAGTELPEAVRTNLLSLVGARFGRQQRLSPDGLVDPIMERQRLFESFISACELMAEAAPLLLVIEDVHWADAGTLSLLQHAARCASRSRLLLCMTYRDSELELSEGGGLSDMLVALNGDRHSEFIRLGRLSRHQSGRLLSALLSTSEVSEPFRDSLFEETEGNPFFMEEVCKGLIEGGKLYFSGSTWHREDMRTVVLPSTVRAAILGRVERLPAATQDALRTAAVLGRDFDFDLLKAAANQDGAVLQTALEQARQAQLVTESRPGGQAGPARYRFAHALIPFALREALGGARLQRLHRRAAQALELVRPGDVEGLAAHFAAGGQRSEALAHTQQAAARAESLYDYETAIQHLHAALRLTDADEMRLALLEQVGDVQQLRDGNADAARAYQEALEIEQTLPAARHLRRVRLLRKLAEAVWTTELTVPVRPFRPAADAALEEGLALMHGQPAHVEVVRLLIARSHSAWRLRVPQDWAAAERDARQAVVLAEALDATLELSSALEALATVFAARDMFRERVEVSLRRVALTEGPRFEASRERALALKEAGAALVDVGEYGQALRFLEDSEKLASRLHAAEILVYALQEQARCYFHLDRWDAVFMEGQLRALLEQQTFQPLQPTCVHQALMACVHSQRGEPEAAAVLRDESMAYMVRWEPPEAWGRGHHYWMSLPLLAAGEFARVTPILDQALKTPSEWIGDHLLYAALVDAAAEKHDERAIRKYAPLAEASARRCGHTLYLAVAHRAWGVAHRLAGEFAQAGERLNQALSIFESLKTLWQLGRTRLELGELAVAQGEMTRARECLQSAMGDFEAMRAAPDVERARAALEALTL